MSDIDTDVDNYTTDELVQLFGIGTPVDAGDVMSAARPMIARATSRGDTDLVNLLNNARDRLIAESKSELDRDKFAEQASDQLLDWRKHRYPPQDNEVQMNKLTDRYNQVQTFDDGSNFPMERQRLGINSGYVLPVAQGNMNPNLKNTIRRTITLDSQFRPNLLPYANSDATAPSFGTDYTVDLTDPLQNVLSLQLYSVQIPTTWYSVDVQYGNTCFDVSGTTMWIQPGNYTYDEYGAAIQTAIRNAGFHDFSSVDVSYSTITSKYTISNQHSPTDLTLTFLQPGGFQDSSCVSCVSAQYVSQNMGWTLGWRIDADASGYVTLDVPASGTATADAAADLYGPKYFVLVLDDYNQNRSNMGLVSTGNHITKLPIPSYTDAANEACSGEPPTSTYVETAPRRLTKSQLYTINQIIEDRAAGETRARAPNPSDVLAVIPLRNVTTTRPQPISEVNTAIRSSIREYFGPVSIARLRVRLLDDRGYPVDLHGADWSILMTATQLYQY